MIRAADDWVAAAFRPGPPGADAEGGDGGGGWLSFLRGGSSGPPGEEPPRKNVPRRRRSSGPVVRDDGPPSREPGADAAARHVPLRRSSAPVVVRDGDGAPPRSRCDRVPPRRPPTVPASVPAGPDGSDGSDGPDDGSVVSEVTLMTYSDERAAMVREEFFRRLQQSDGGKLLSLQEKGALLREVYGGQEDLFRRRREEEEGRRSVAEARERFEAEEGGERRPSEPDEGHQDGMAHLVGTGDENDAGNEEPSASRRLENAEALNLLDDALNGVSLESVPANKKSPANGKRGGAGLQTAGRRSPLPHSSKTTKCCNDAESRRNGGQVSAASDDASVEGWGAAEGPATAAPCADAPLGNHYVPTSKKARERARPEETQGGSPARRGAGPGQRAQGCRERDGGPDHRAKERQGCEESAPGIAEIVDLKLLVAEQQAAIDTLSSEVHNLRLADRRRRGSADPGDPEARNRDLARRPDRSQGAEAGPKVLWAGLRRELDPRQSNLGDSDRARAKLEGRNRALERENRELRRMLKESQRRAVLDHSHRSGGGRSQRSSVRSSVLSSETTHTTAALSTDGESAAARTLQR